MKYFYENKILKVTQAEFDAEQSLFCGQTFRFQRTPEGIKGVVAGKLICVKNENGDTIISNVEEQDVDFWLDYFDFNRDYEEMKNEFAKDEYLRKGMEYAPGIRVLNQEHFETLISFIISANNNISRISLIISRLCEKYGKKIEEGYYSFPTPQELKDVKESDYAAIGAGYRARYLEQTVHSILNGFDLSEIANMEYETAKKKLLTLMGVGGKVADCILLFSYKFSNAFPMDVWMKRVVKKLYGINADKNAQKQLEERFGTNAGIAQQYLFHYARNHSEEFEN